RPLPAWQRLWRCAWRRPAATAWILVGTALVCLLVTAWSYFRAATELAGHRALENYQQFIERRNEALVHGLLGPEEAAVFLGTEATANLQAAESAARAALTLAGIDVNSGTASPAACFPSHRKDEIAADCYTLLLVLAGMRAQQPAPGHAGRQHDQEALRILDRARQLGLQTRAYHWRRALVLERLGLEEEAREQRRQAASVPLEGPLDYFLAGEEQY